MGSHRRWKHARWKQDGVRPVMTETAPNCSPFLPRRTYFPLSLRPQPDLVTQAESWTHQHHRLQMWNKRKLSKLQQREILKNVSIIVGSIMVGKHFWLKSEELHLSKSSQHTIFSLSLLSVYLHSAWCGFTSERFWAFERYFCLQQKLDDSHSVVGFSYNLLIIIFRVKECQ